MSIATDVFQDALKDVTEPLTGAKAREEAEQKSIEDRLKAQVAAQAARVFSETEGQGMGTFGEVVFSVDEEEDDEMVSNQVFKY